MPGYPLYTDKMAEFSAAEREALPAVVSECSLFPKGLERVGSPDGL